LPALLKKQPSTKKRKTFEKSPWLLRYLKNITNESTQPDSRILKANLSWSRKKVEFEWCKNFFVCIYIFLFCT